MKKATLLDLGEIHEVLSESDHSDYLMDSLRGTITNDQCGYYISEDRNIVLSYFPCSQGVWTEHIARRADSRVSGRDLKIAAISAGLDFCRSHPDLQAIFNVVKKEDRHLRLFMATFKEAERVSTFPNGDIMYLITIDKFEEFEKTLKEMT